MIAVKYTVLQAILNLLFSKGVQNVKNSANYAKFICNYPQNTCSRFIGQIYRCSVCASWIHFSSGKKKKRREKKNRTTSSQHFLQQEIEANIKFQSEKA